jgi:hypothetical protein
MYLVRSGEICEVQDEAQAGAALKRNPELLEVLIAEMIDLMAVLARRDTPGEPESDDLEGPRGVMLTEEELASSLRWLLSLRREASSTGIN